MVVSCNCLNSTTKNRQDTRYFIRTTHKSTHIAWAFRSQESSKIFYKKFNLSISYCIAIATFLQNPHIFILPFRNCTLDRNFFFFAFQYVASDSDSSACNCEKMSFNGGKYLQCETIREHKTAEEWSCRVAATQKKLKYMRIEHPTDC